MITNIDSLFRNADPVIAGILIWIMNKKSVLGKFINNKTQI